jgi:hypothetical protein
VGSVPTRSPTIAPSGTGDRAEGIRQAASMTSRSGRGRSERVIAARRQARAALCHDLVSGDPSDAPPRRKTPLASPPASVWVASDPSTTEYVLSLGEAAGRLGLNRAELEAMIQRGDVETLQGEFIRAIPTREIKRLSSR